jgi:hypothetical protein
MDRVVQIAGGKGVTVLTRSILDKQGCENPDCADPDCGNELYFHSQCCEGAGLQAMYAKSCGHLNLFCDGCGEPLAVIEVASGFVCN